MSDKSVVAAKYPTREVTLTRSKIVVTVPTDWHVSDSTAAQRYGKGDPVKFNQALIQRVCLFDGETIPIDAIAEKISGKDWLQLMGEVFGDDEDEAGNA